MDTYDTIFVEGSRCGWRDILKIHSCYLTWIYMNGYSSIFLQSEGRKILRPAWGSGRCLAEVLGEGSPKLLDSKVCALPTPGYSALNTDPGFPHTAVPTVNQGIKDTKCTPSKRMRNTGRLRKKVPPFLLKPKHPPRIQRV